ncbi:hypothetical protein M2375_000405 [Comamonas sp. BIGb0152]|nr:hypothetical protein [Comamonas sp. BIGb0152]
MHGGCVACMQRDRQRRRHGSAFILRPLQGSAAYGRAAEALLLARPQKAGGGIPLLACAMALSRATSRTLRTLPFYSHGFLRIILICEYHRPQGSAIAAVPCFIVGRPTGFSLQWSFLLANGSPCSQAFFSTLNLLQSLGVLRQHPSAPTCSVRTLDTGMHPSGVAATPPFDAPTAPYFPQHRGCQARYPMDPGAATRTGPDKAGKNGCVVQPPLKCLVVSTLVQKALPWSEGSLGRSASIRRDEGCCRWSLRLGPAPAPAFGGLLEFGHQVHLLSL